MKKQDLPDFSGGGSLIWANDLAGVLNTDFENNIATRTNGTCINTMQGKLILSKSNFINNVNNTGGAGAVAFNPSATYITECKFEENKASGTIGGALYGKTLYYGVVGDGTKIENSQFIKNKAKVEGGAIFLDDIRYNLGAKKLLIKDCEFNENSAEDKGGAIATNHIKESVYGGGYTYGEAVPGEIRIENCKFNKNIARKNGMPKWLKRLK